MKGPARHRLTRGERREWAGAMLFISPWIIGFLAFTLYPMAKALYYSFTSYNLLQPPKWVGVHNYQRAFTSDPNFWLSLSNTGVYALMIIPAGTVLAILLAMLLNTKVRGLALFRTIYYLPSVLPLVATALVWSWVLDPQYGYINEVLIWMGVHPAPGWLADPPWVKPAFAIMGLWGMGNAIIIYLAALQGVPQHLYEAAELDGAGDVGKFWHVTIPMISPAILFNVVLLLIGTFQFFTQPFVLEGGAGSNTGSVGGADFGGPLQAGLFYSPYLWQNAFSFFRMGYASALAWILFAVIMIFTLLVLRLSRSRVYYEEAA